MEVEEEGHPCGGLVFGHGGYDGNVDLGVAEIEDLLYQNQNRTANRYLTLNFADTSL